MKLDLDRLHKVVSGQVEGRQRGQTFSNCMEVVAQLELGGIEKLILVVPELRWKDHIIPMLGSIMEERGLELIYKRPTLFQCGAVELVFVGRSNEHFFLGRDNYGQVVFTY